MFGSDSMDQHVRITTAAALENAAKQKVKTCDGMRLVAGIPSKQKKNREL